MIGLRSPAGIRLHCVRAGGLIVIVFFCGACGAQMQDSVKQSIDYVAGLEEDCILDHGYRCAETSEDDFLSAAAHQRMIPAVYLAAWQASYEDFQSQPDLSAEQKDLKHYKIGFTHNESEYIVLFQALLLPEIVDGTPQGIIRATFGRSTKYWIDRDTLAVNKRLFMK